MIPISQRKIILALSFLTSTVLSASFLLSLTSCGSPAAATIEPKLVSPTVTRIPSSGSVHGGGWCTAADRGRYFSFRRDGVTGRMATLAWLE